VGGLPVTARPDDPAVCELRNLGPRSAEWLGRVGIDRLSDLEAVGAEGAYRRLADAGIGRLSLVMLWALEGALQDVDWRDLPPEERERLRAARAGLLPPGPRGS